MQKLKILWYKIKAKIISSVVNLFASQSNHDIKNTVLLIGSTRSGTTFLMESLNKRNDYRLIFEPFNPTYTKEWNSFSARHYINPHSVSNKERQAVDNILRGKIKNKWIDQYNKKIRSEKRLVKSVRANLMIDYIEIEYSDLPIIYIYRNPYDVVASRMNLNFDPRDIELILEHDDFLEKYYSDVDIENLKLLFKFPECCHAALWCFENRFILQSRERRRMKMTNFNDIVGKTVTYINGEVVMTNKTRQPSVTSTLRKSYDLTEIEKWNVDLVIRLFEMTDILRKSWPNKLAK